MKMEFEGTISMMWQEETVWQNNLRKVTFVLEWDPNDKWFKQSLVLEQLWDNKVDAVKDLAVWDRVKISLDCRAKEYNGRWYNGLSAWRVEKVNWATATNNAPVDDDLPF